MIVERDDRYEEIIGQINATESPQPSREQRLEAAFQAALPLLGKQFDRRSVIDGADARIAAAKGLIAAGIGEASDVDAVTRAFRERGVQRRGEDAALIWGRVPGSSTKWGCSARAS